MKELVIKNNWNLIKNLLLVAFAFLFVLMTSCSTGQSSAKVKMKIDNKTAHVNLGTKDVRVGDTVNFYKNECAAYSGVVDATKGDTVHCDLKFVGSGTVNKLFNDKYSEVKTDGTFKLQKGILVQKEVYSE